MCHAYNIAKRCIKSWRPSKSRTDMSVEDQYHKYNVFCSVESPDKIGRFFKEYMWEDQEHFLAIYLDNGNHIVDFDEITTGLVNQTPVHPREAFRNAIVKNAVSIIFAHNHPSGSTEPSEDDWAITRILCAAGKILWIPVIDHIIIGKGGYTSLCRMDPDIFENTMQRKKWIA